MNICVLTARTIEPPWDEGGKNLVKEIVSNISNFNFYLFSSIKKFKLKKANIRLRYIPSNKKSYYSMPYKKRLLLFIELLKIYRRVNIFHLFYTPKYPSSMFFKFFLKIGNKKSVQTLTSIYHLYFFNKNKNLKKVLFSDKIIVLSDFAKNKLLDNGIKNVKRIYPGVNLKEFKPNIKNLSLKKRLKLVNKPIILYAGDFNILKESRTIHHFIDIISLSVKKIPDLKFIIACRIRSKKDECEQEYFKKHAKKRSLDKSIIYLNTVKNMSELISVCDLCIYPSKKEITAKLEIPLILLEALAEEKPIVINNIRPLNEIMKDNVGIIVKNGDAELFSNSLIKLIKDIRLRKTMGKLGRKVAKKYFNNENMVKEYQKVYESLK